MSNNLVSSLTRPGTKPSAVFVFIYDLSKGLSPLLSVPILGKYVSAIYHSSIVFRDIEIYFGRKGIVVSKPGRTSFGTPVRVVYLGATPVSHATLRDWLSHQRTSDFHSTKYHLLQHNCNTFANFCAIFLTGNSIPHEVLFQTKNLINSPNGALLEFLVGAFENF